MREVSEKGDDRGVDSMEAVAGQYQIVNVDGKEITVREK